MKKLSDFLTPREVELLKEIAKENPELLEKLEKEIRQLQQVSEHYRLSYRKMKYAYEANVDPFKKTNIPKP